MNEKKLLPVIISFVVFLLAGLVIYSGMFNLPSNVFIENPLDHFYLIMVNILFWLPGAFLINKLIDKLIWKKVIVLPVGNSSIQWVQNFTGSLVYTIAIFVILKAAFFVEFTSLSILILFVLLIAFAFLKPKVIYLFTKESFQRNRPFNKGDWISIKNNSGNVLAVGEVFNFNRGSVTVLNEDDNLVFITDQVLTNSAIENFRSFSEYSRFTIDISLDKAVSIERGKRILTAASLHALEEIGLLNEKLPNVLIQEIKQNGIVYKVGFRIKVSREIPPSKVKDRILKNIIEHCGKSGVVISENEKVEMLSTNEIIKSTNFDLVHDRAKILKNILFFKFLNESEIDKLAAGLNVFDFKKGSKIITQGDHGDSMFILIEGLMNVFIHNADTKKLLVGKIFPGDFLGEMSLFTGEPRAASVEAFSDCFAFELKKELLTPILQNRPDLVEEFGRLIVQRQKYNAELIAKSGMKEQSLIEFIVNKIKSFFHLKN